jgi:hypothetical protein
MESAAHIYEIRPRKDQSGFDLISSALASGGLSYEKATDAIKYAKAHCRSHDAVILVYDESGNAIEAYEHSKEFREQFDEYVKLCWRSSSEWVLETQGQLTKWLFTLHGAGIAGSLGPRQDLHKRYGRSQKAEPHHGLQNPARSSRHTARFRHPAYGGIEKHGRARRLAREDRSDRQKNPGDTRSTARHTDETAGNSRNHGQQEHARNYTEIIPALRPIRFVAGNRVR